MGLESYFTPFLTLGNIRIPKWGDEADVNLAFHFSLLRTESITKMGPGGLT